MIKLTWCEKQPFIMRLHWLIPITGSCNYFYHYVPLEAGYSPPCDPTGVSGIMLHCSGYAPPSAAVDLIWMWSPDMITPFIEAEFLTNNWSPSTSQSTPSSGPYAGYQYHETNLMFTSPGVTASNVGYYACIFIHRDTSTTPVFELTPALPLLTSPGVTTPCPALSPFNFAEIFTPDICAEAADPTTTTTEAMLTTETTTGVVESECCELATYLGIAAALVTTVCICALSSIVFLIGRAVKKMYRKRRRKIYVGKSST